MLRRVAAGAPRCKLFYNDVFRVDLPPNHRFPMAKYELVRRELQRLAQPQIDFDVSPLVSMEDLETTHCKEYVRRFLNNEMTARENRNVGFPWSNQSVERSLSSVGGTVAAMKTVLDGHAHYAGHVAGGTHHAYHAHGEGYCVFNDIGVAANVALRDYSSALNIVVIDLDVHQGNGTAALFADEPRVRTVSMHCRQVTRLHAPCTALAGDVLMPCSPPEHFQPARVFRHRRGCRSWHG